MAKTKRQHPHRPVSLMYADYFPQWGGPRTVRPQGTDDYLVVATVGGVGTYRHREGVLELREGMLYLTRPGTPHDYGPKRGGDWRIRWSHFHPRPHWLQWLDWPEVVPGLMMLQVNDAANWSQIIGALETAARQVAGPPPRSIHFAMNTLEQMLLWCDAVNPRSQRMRFDPRVADAMEYICRRLGEKIILADVARAVHLSPSRLAHLFREQVGLTPGQFLEQQRMDRARQLLQLTPLPVSAVADQLGFDSPFYFTRRFTRLTGRSPRQYRQETSGEAATSAGGTA